MEDKTKKKYVLNRSGDGYVAMKQGLRTCESCGFSWSVNVAYRDNDKPRCPACGNSPADGAGYTGRNDDGTAKTVAHRVRPSTRTC